MNWLIAKGPLIVSAGQVGLFGIIVGLVYGIGIAEMNGPSFETTFLPIALFAIAAVNVVSPGHRDNEALAWKSRPLW